ncbi:hypothetical protein DINM_004586 [Dirofilaria immitis]|nr:hypothetical protein [Dirofilaria immitis]
MGVLRRNSRLLMTNFVTLDDYLIDDESEVETQPENDASEAIAANSTPNRRRQKDARNIKKAQWLSDMAAQLLYSTVNAEDICEDYSDILQSTVTALSKLFIEEENMQAWNTFIEKNEEEQREFLKSFEAGKVRQHCSYCDDSPPEGVDVFEHQACNGYKEKYQGNIGYRYSTKDKNSGHPSYSAEVSFSRLNRRFRMILRHKALPMEFMAVNEKEMRKFFHKNVLPVSEWSSSVLPRLQRVVIGNGDEKLVKVRNKYYSFRPPSETLVDYLKRMHGANNAGKNLS